ncbi:hypothetical protein HPB48_001222 [Haemaphysalis longicornis]|uniref:Cardioactive peptide n=1 Tax=Haemaphysalis longicornis TaxID=44386 RepID=A0A9J6FJY5_HAELO|nr:hypothetical protein HPB48_001222 [Haemaphysalis longicornis]
MCASSSVHVRGENASFDCDSRNLWFSSATLLFCSDRVTNALRNRRARPLSEQDDATEERFLPEQKRPFCNAFTGCGGKRSQYSTRNLMSRLRQKILADAAHSQRRFFNQLTDDADSRSASSQDDVSAQRGYGPFTLSMVASQQRPRTESLSV